MLIIKNYMINTYYLNMYSKDLNQATIDSSTIAKTLKWQGMSKYNEGEQKTNTSQTQSLQSWEEQEIECIDQENCFTLQSFNHQQDQFNDGQNSDAAMQNYYGNAFQQSLNNIQAKINRIYAKIPESKSQRDLIIGDISKVLESVDKNQITPYKVDQINQQNKMAFIKLLRKKLFKAPIIYSWQFEKPIYVKQLIQDFEKEQIKVIGIDQNRVLLYSQPIQQTGNQKQYQDIQESSSKQQTIEFNPHIIPISCLKIDYIFFNKVSRSKQQCYLSLVNIFKQYQNVEVKESIEFEKEIKSELYINFESKYSMLQFAQQICQLGFRITKQGQIKQQEQSKQQAGQLYKYNQSQYTQFGIEIKEIKIKREIKRQNVQKANFHLREQGIWHFLPMWENGFKQQLQTIIQNLDVYKSQFSQSLITFARLLIYRTEKLKLISVTLNSGTRPQSKSELKSENQFVSSKDQNKCNIKPEGFSKIANIEVGVENIFDKLILKEVQNMLYYLINNLGILKYQGQVKKAKHQYRKNNSTHWEATQIQYQRYLQNIKRDQKIKEDQETQKIISSYILYKANPANDVPFTMKINSTKKTLSQYLNQKQIQEKNKKIQIIELRKIITYINHCFPQSVKSKQTEYNKIKSTNQVQNKTHQSFFYKIEEERLVQSRCLGCATFFKVATNILDQTVNYVPFKVFPSVGQMKDYQSQIKDNMCAMLNSGGGIILFDCYYSNQKIIVRGTKISQKNKEQHQQRFSSYLDSFYPKDNLKKCIIISFVPVISESYIVDNNKSVMEYYNGQDSLIKQNQSYRLRPYLQSTYVMRVRICPAHPEAVYYWNQNNDKQQREINKSFLCTRFIGNTIKSIPLGRISKLIKQKVKEYYIPERFTESQKLYLEKPSNYFSHQCKKPQAGVGFQQDNEEKFKNVLPLDLTTNNFQNMSLVVAREKHLSQIQNRLISEGIQCKIEQKFKDQNFSAAKHTAVIHHNKKFEELLKKVLHNQKFVYNGKGLIVINITNYIRLSQRSELVSYPQGELITLKKWLKKRFDDEKLSLFEFRPNQKTRQYYLHSQSQESTLYIYYVLNSYRQKAVFKNPLHLDKMDQKEKAHKFIELYTENNHAELI